MVGLRCFLPGLTKKVSPQNREKMGKEKIELLNGQMPMFTCTWPSSVHCSFSHFFPSSWTLPPLLFLLLIYFIFFLDVTSSFIFFFFLLIYRVGFVQCMLLIYIYFLLLSFVFFFFCFSFRCDFFFLDMIFIF